MHPPLVEFYGVTSTWCQENLPKCKYLSLTRAHSYSNGQFFRRFSFRFLRLAATRLKQGQTGKTEIFAMVNNTAKSQVYGIFTCIARTIWIKRNTLLQITNPNFNMAKCYLSFFTSHQSKLSPPPKKRVNLPKQSGPPKNTTTIKHHHRRKSENGTFSRYLCTKSRIAAPLEAAASLFSKVFTLISLRLQHSVLEGRKGNGM